MDTEENKHNPTPTKPISHFPPSILPSLTQTSHGIIHKGRREKAQAQSSHECNMAHAQSHRIQRKKRKGRCPKKQLDDDKVGIERKIGALQSLVPGGEGLGPDKLFEKTYDYIVAMQVKVHAMKILAGLFDG